jgi:hypothetical protein
MNNTNLDLNNREWGEFIFEEIFNINSSQSSIDRNKLNEKKGATPYITRSNTVNGYDSFIGKQDDKYSLDEGNVITVGLDTQTVFYQPEPFYTGQNIQVLRNNNLTANIAKFLVPLIELQMKKFSWGSNGATLKRLKRQKLILPINTVGELDYRFMEEYVKHKEKERLDKYIEYLKGRVKQLEDYEEVEALDEKKWGEFKMSSIFHIESGVRLTKSDMNKGKRPFIGATDSNNGITGYVSNENKSLDSNVLGVNYNGSVVESFYHPYNAIFSDDVKRLSFKGLKGNKHLYLFVKTEILKQKEKYQYGYKFNAMRMRKQTIILPINKVGQPDFEYMKSYMEQLELKKIKDYLRYKNIDLS